MANNKITREDIERAASAPDFDPQLYNIARLLLEIVERFVDRDHLEAAGTSEKAHTPVNF